ncbi:MAG: ABC transporter permease subunit [Actinomycetota bacterium]
MADRALPVLAPRRRIVVVAAIAILWSAQRVGLFDGNNLNSGGWDAFASFWAGIVDPDTSATFIRLTLQAAGVTIAYAVLGTAVSLIIGVGGAPLLAERLWPTRAGALLRWIATAVFVVPRAVHEIVWALLLLEVFGFDPWVAVIAIGVPFGAVTAKVYAETIDEADLRPYELARATGARRSGALLYAVFPTIRGELVSYAFYRLECAVRSAAVVGIIGVGGLGFQLDLSFETLNYSEIWTIIAALVLVSGLADRWSTLVRRSHGARGRLVRRWSVVAATALFVWSWNRVDLDPSALWSERTRRRAGELVDALWPPALGPDGWGELINATLDTAAMSIIAVVLAGAIGVIAGAVVARPTGELEAAGPLRRTVRWLVGAVLLLLRAVPAPVWAFVVVLVVFAGPLPGAIALGVYNIGVIGRLVGEAFEERPADAHDLALASGASRPAAFVAVRLPDTAGRIIAIVMYRWEVIVRETIVVGVVGAGGLGQLLRDHLAARDFDALTGTILAMLLLAIVVDQLSRVVRRNLIGGVRPGRDGAHTDDEPDVADRVAARTAMRVESAS